jgi:hypothetical protein
MRPLVTTAGVVLATVFLLGLMVLSWHAGYNRMLF